MIKLDNKMDLFLTSPDWTEFSYSRQIEKIERIRIGLFTYLLVTTVDPIENSIDNTKSKQILLTTALHFISSNYIGKLPIELNVFAVKKDLNDKIKCGDCLAKGVDLHVKNK